MNYDKNSFLAGLSVGRTLKGWAGGGTTGYVIIGMQPSRKYTAIRLPDFNIQWG